MLDHARAFSAVGLVLLFPVHAESIIRSNPPPEIRELAVVADRQWGDVLVSWSGGTPPFTVVRCDREVLREAKHLRVIGHELRERRFVDRRALLADERFYYQVYDSNSVPRIFGFSADGGLPGAEIKVRGVAFSADCEEITIQIGGVDAPTKLDCSFAEFTFKIPANAVTGSVVVATPAGATVAGTEADDPERARSW